MAEDLTLTLALRFGGNIFTAFLMAGIIGILLGLINALIIYFFNIPSIVTTIARQRFGRDTRSPLAHRSNSDG